MHPKLRDFALHRLPVPKAARFSLPKPIIPFGATGYVALFEIASPSIVLLLALRRQREADYS